MKKKRWICFLFMGNNKKVFKIMRLTAILLFGFVLSVSANSYSQNTRLDLKLRNASIAEIFEYVEANSEFVFLYQNEDVDVNQTKSINLHNATIFEILDLAFEGQNISYHVYDRQIVISKAESGAPSVSVQEKGKITGLVTSSDGEPIPGVSIVVKGTTIGTVSDINGGFSLSVPEDATTLVFSFVGMLSQEVKIEGKSVINVIMQEDVQGLDEVVVVGYGTQKKANLTGSVATVSTDELVEVPAVNIVQRLQGRISGVTIINSHTPGGGATVRVRGLGTINNNDPLYVIDGVPTKEGLSQLNPNDIESVTVLKDAASAAIYGAGGANGVIIVTTKRGKAGESNISFDARMGVSNVTKRFNLLNTREYGELLWLEAKNDGVSPGNQLYGYGAAPDIPEYILPARAAAGSAEVDPSLYNYDMDNLYLIMKANKEGTNWNDEVLRAAMIQEYNLSVTGGSNDGGYAFSGGYMKEEGTLLNTGFERFSIRSNANTKLKNWLEVGESLGVVYTHAYGNQSDNSEGTVISQVYRMQPIIPVYDIMGNFAGTKAPSTGNGQNPVAMLERDKNDYNNNIRAIGNIYAQADIVDGLKFKTLFGFDYRTGHYKDIFIKNPEFSEAKPTDKLNEGSNVTRQWNWQNLLTYNKTFNDVHNVSVLLGTEAVAQVWQYMSAGRTTYFSTDPDYMLLDSGEGDQTNNGKREDWSTVSYFGKVNYNYQGKYLMEATFRRDGSSRFGQNNRWGNFPAFSTGWRISEESFMEETRNWLEDLKLRAAWGQTGNSEIGNYNGFTTFYTSNIHSYYGLDGSNTSTTAGFDSYAFGNPDAKWETTTTIDFGLDATMFNSALSVTFDWWQRKTSDMLFIIPRAAVEGQARLPSVNIADMNNVGFDLSFIYRGDAVGGDLKYTITANVSHYKNEITKLDGEEKPFYRGRSERQMMYTAYNVGTSFPEFYGYKVEGIFQTQAEADAWPTAFGSDGTYNEPGRFKYADINNDGVIDGDDRTWIGSPHPDFTSGLTFDLEYKNWDLTAFFFTSYGNEIMNYVRRWTDYTNFQGNRSKDRLYKSWGSPYLSNNADAKLAKAEKLNDKGNQQPSSHFVEDGSYLRMKNLQIGYSLPDKTLQKIGFKRVRLYLQATNLFTITKYSGLDPEINAGGVAMGIDRGAWPTPKQFLFGVNVGL